MENAFDSMIQAMAQTQAQSQVKHFFLRSGEYGECTVSTTGNGTTDATHPIAEFGTVRYEESVGQRNPCFFMGCVRVNGWEFCAERYPNDNVEYITAFHIASDMHYKFGSIVADVMEATAVSHIQSIVDWLAANGIVFVGSPVTDSLEEQKRTFAAYKAFQNSYVVMLNNCVHSGVVIPTKDTCHLLIFNDAETFDHYYEKRPTPSEADPIADIRIAELPLSEYNYDALPNFDCNCIIGIAFGSAEDYSDTAVVYHAQLHLKE